MSLTSYLAAPSRDLNHAPFSAGAGQWTGEMELGKSFFALVRFL